MTSTQAPQQPKGWTNDMTHFIRNLLVDEDINSVMCLFEVEFYDVCKSMEAGTLKDWIDSIRTSVNCVYGS